VFRRTRNRRLLSPADIKAERQQLCGSLRGGQVNAGRVVELGRSVDALQQFVEIVLHGGHGGDDRRRTEAVRDHREVTEMALDGRVERRSGRRQSAGGRQERPSTERRLIADEHVDELLHRLSTDTNITVSASNI